MCGRFTLLTLAEFTNLFPWIAPPEEPPPARFNIAPSQPVAVVPNTPEHRIQFFKWGLVPSWARDPTIGNRMINARAESLAEKPAFRNALRHKRCLVLADGFYEWRKEPRGPKTPVYIRLKGGRPFAFAGLWDEWPSPDGSPLRTCTIITAPPNELIAPIHSRMPVVLLDEDYARWADPRPAEADALLPMLRPYPADLMEAYPVSLAVNDPHRDAPELIVPAGREQEGRGPATQPDLFGI